MFEVLAVEAVLGISEDNIDYYMGQMRDSEDGGGIHSGHMGELTVLYTILAGSCYFYIKSCQLSKKDTLRIRITEALSRLAGLVMWGEPITSQEMSAYIEKDVIPVSRMVVTFDEDDKTPLLLPAKGVPYFLEMAFFLLDSSIPFDEKTEVSKIVFGKDFVEMCELGSQRLLEVASARRMMKGNKNTGASGLADSLNIDL